MIPINVTLYFYNCSDVNMFRVEVFNSSQATGVVMYDTNGQIQVTECTFFNNSAEEGTLGGGGFAVEFTYCSPGNTLCPNDFREYDPGYRRVNVPAEYNFTDCHFEENIARSQNYTSSAGNLIFATGSALLLIQTRREYKKQLQYGRHGGSRRRRHEPCTRAEA